MRHFSAARLAFIVLLGLTLAWKLSVRADATFYIEQNILDFLQRGKFDVAAADFSMDNFPVVRARKGDCSMQVMKANYYGADRDSIAALKGGDDSLFFVYRGRVYAEQPIGFIVADQILMRLLRRLGLVDHEPPVIAVVASSACAADRLPWRELGEEFPFSSAP